MVVKMDIHKDIRFSSGYRCSQSLHNLRRCWKCGWIAVYHKPLLVQLLQANEVSVLSQLVLIPIPNRYHLGSCFFGSDYVPHDLLAAFYQYLLFEHLNVGTDAELVNICNYLPEVESMWEVLIIVFLSLCS